MPPFLYIRVFLDILPLYNPKNDKLAARGCNGTRDFVKGNDKGKMFVVMAGLVAMSL